MWLKQSTASQEISLGPFLDSTDGNTEESGLTIANTDIKIRKGGATTLSNKNSGGATYISNGVYHATLDSTDTDTLGMLEVYVHVSGALAVKSVYMVLPSATYDALVTNGLNDISTAQVNTEVDTALNDYDAPTNAELNARTIVSANYATAANLAIVDTNVDAILVDTGTSIPFGITVLDAKIDDVKVDTTAILIDTNELQLNQGNWLTATGFATTAEIADVPTVAEFNARTLPGADYFVVTDYTAPPSAATISAQVWSETTRVLTAGTNIALAKGVGVTGFNDIAATDIVSGGAITTSAGNANVDVVKINGTTVLGNGSSGNLWRA